MNVHFPYHGKDTGPCRGERFDEDTDIQNIDLGMLRKFMPPGVEPLEDFFDVLNLQEDIRKDDPRLGSRVVFTLRASYERMRELELGIAQMTMAHEQQDSEIRCLQARANVPFQHQGDTCTFRITQALDPDSHWGLPGNMLVEVTRSNRYGSDSHRTFRYVLIEDEHQRPAATPHALAWKALQRIKDLMGGGQPELDPQEVMAAVEGWRHTYATLDEEILKICGVEPHEDTPTLVAVQNLAEHAQQLSLENVRLREERDAAKRGDYVHPRRYVRALEDTLLAMGRLLGHKTLPTQGGLVPYDKQMTNYCSRLLQAVRTRMTNIKSKQRSK